MDRSAPAPSCLPATVAAPPGRGRLFRKYAAMFVGVVSTVLVVNGAFEIWFSYQEQKNLLFRIQHEEAKAVAARITEFVDKIEDQMAWSTLVPWDGNTFEEWRFDAARLLRETPAVAEVAQLDSTGHELFRISRQAVDVIASHRDYSHEPFFLQALAHKIYYSPVYFVGGSEPYMTLAMAGERPEYGVIEAQVNLKFIWDVVSKVKVGQHGYAYVVDRQGRLIAHPDISLVLRQSDMSQLPQIQAARNAAPEFGSWFAVDAERGSVLSANALVEPVDWLVFVELSTHEAFEPIYSSIFRSVLLLIAALTLALLAGLTLARRMVIPIRALSDSAARLGGGDLAHRIAIDNGDELGSLGGQFNLMAERLQESYVNLERKVEERTEQLEAANLAKSRFLAAASHDLRQPLHAVGLFVALLHGRLRASERKLIVERIEAALAATNELFNALLDISKLDAGALTPNITVFPVAQLLGQIETTFAEAAREKGISLRVVRSSAWIRSDFILVERIVFNLISNAIRYTQHGGIVVGCRRHRNDNLRIEVWDTGSGIPIDQQEKIFGEFYRLDEPDRDSGAGLGLGLAIVDRLCRLLEYSREVKSAPGRGSVFAVTVPAATAVEAPQLAAPNRDRRQVSRGKLILVIDDDPFSLEGMDGILRSWGCQVITADTDSKALKALINENHPPDLIISDYHLSSGRNGLEIIERLRAALAVPIPAFLISGDINADPAREAEAKGFHILHKPVSPMALRAMLHQALKRGQNGGERPVAH